MTRDELTTTFEATARHITELHVIDPSMLLEPRCFATDQADPSILFLKGDI